MAERDKITKELHATYNDVFFSRIGCFKVTFSLQVREDAKPYQAPPSHVGYALQQPFKKELV